MEPLEPQNPLKMIFTEFYYIPLCVADMGDRLNSSGQILDTQSIVSIKRL
jgi:hypothetical protein